MTGAALEDLLNGAYDELDEPMADAKNAPLGPDDFDDDFLSDLLDDTAGTL